MNVLNEFHAAIFSWPCVLSDRPPVLWWLSPGEGRDAVGYKVKRAQVLKIKVNVSSIYAKGCMLTIVCYLT